MELTSILLPGWVPEGAQARIGRGVINQIALSPDGKTVAVAGATGLSLLNAETFEEVWCVPTSKEMTHVAFSPDGETLTSLSFRIVWGAGHYVLDEAYIWDASSGQNLRSIPVQGSDEEELLFALSQDGQTLAIWNYHTMDRITIWDLATGQTRRTLDTSRFAVREMTLSTDGTYLAAMDAETIRIWNTFTGDTSIAYQGYGRVIAFSPDRKIIAISKTDGVTLVDTTSGVILNVLKSPVGSFHLLAFSPDGKILAAGSGYGIVVLWNLPNGRLIGSSEELGSSFHAVYKFNKAISGLVFHPDERSVFASTMDGIYALDAESGHRLRSVSYPFSRWEQVHFDADGTRLALMTKGKIKYLDAANYEDRELYELPEYIALSPDFLRYADLSAEEEITIHDIRTGKILCTLRAPKEEPWSLEEFIFSPDGKTAATIHYSYTTGGEGIDLWDLAGGKIIKTLACQPTQSGVRCKFAFSPDGKRAAIGFEDGEHGEQIEIIDVVSGKRIYHHWDVGSFLFAFTSDSRGIATGCDNWPRSDYICVFDLDDGREVQRFPKKWFLFTYAEFSPDDRLFAYGTASGYIYIHRVSDGDLLYAFDNHNNPIHMFSFSPDGKTLANTSEDGSVVLWNVEE